MTVGSLSPGRLHGGELSAEPERLRGTCNGEKRKGEF